MNGPYITSSCELACAASPLTHRGTRPSGMAPPRLPVLAARQGIVNVFLLNTVHFGALISSGFHSHVREGWRSDDRRDTRGVLSALGATVFAVTPEAALRCPRQQRH